MAIEKPKRARLPMVLVSISLIAGIIYFLAKGAWWVSVALMLAEGIVETSSPFLFRRKPKRK